MSEPIKGYDHQVNSKWREMDIAAKTERVVALMAWVDHTMDLIEMLPDEKRLIQELRTALGSVRTKIGDINREVGELKAEIVDRNPTQGAS